MRHAGGFEDDNESRSLATGVGIDVFALLGVARHSLSLKYDYYDLDFEQASTRYFSPSDFKVHTPGLDWRYRPTEQLWLGLEAGMPMRVGGADGYVAGGFFSWSPSATFALEGRVRVMDDTQYRVTSFILGPRIAF